MTWFQIMTLEDYSNNFYVKTTVFGQPSIGTSFDYSGPAWIGGQGNPRFTTFGSDQPIDCTLITNATLSSEWRSYGLATVGGGSVPAVEEYNGTNAGMPWRWTDYAPGYPATSSGYMLLKNSTLPTDTWYGTSTCGPGTVYPSNPSPADIRGKWKAMQRYLKNLAVSASMDLMGDAIYWYGTTPLTGTKMVVASPDTITLNRLFHGAALEKIYNIPNHPGLVIQVPVDDCELVVNATHFSQSGFGHSLCNAIWNIYPTESAIAKCTSFTIRQFDGQFTGLLLAPEFDLRLYAAYVNINRNWIIGQAVVRSFTTHYTTSHAPQTLLTFDLAGCRSYNGCMVDCY